MAVQQLQSIYKIAIHNKYTPPKELPQKKPQDRYTQQPQRTTQQPRTTAIQQLKQPHTTIFNGYTTTKKQPHKRFTEQPHNSL